MKKTLSIAFVFAVILPFGFARNTKLYAQQISSEADLQTKLLLYYDARNPPGSETARRIRDEIVRYSLDLIDGNYDQYANKIYRGRSRQTTSKSVLDLVSGIDTTTKPKSITSGDCAKKNYAACFLSSLTAEQANKKPSKELDAEVLLLAMEIARTQAAAEIKERLKLGNNDYPLDLARRDLRNYFFAGTPVGAARGLGVMLERMKKTDDGKDF